jgi:hypothetical protein
MCFLSWPQFPSKRLSCFQVPWFPANSVHSNVMTHEPHNSSRKRISDQTSCYWLKQLSTLLQSLFHPSHVCTHTHHSVVQRKCTAKRIDSVYTLSHVKQYDFSFIPRATPPLHSTSNFGWRKVETCQFDSAKGFCLSIFTHDSEAGKKTQQSLNPKQ